MSNTRLFDNVPDWAKINVDNSKFILEEAKDYLTYITEAADKITSKAFTILSILFPIQGALLAYIINEKIKKSIHDEIIFNLLFFDVCSLLFIMLYLCTIVLPRLFMPLGRKPEELCNNNELLGIDDVDKSSYLALILNEIENCHNKIKFNTGQNNRRIAVLQVSMIAIGCIMVISIITIYLHFFK